MGKGKNNIKDNIPDPVTDGLDNIKDEVNDGLDNVQDGVNDIVDDVIPDINIDIDVDDWIPSDIQKKLGDGADTIAKMMRNGYDNLDVKGNYIDPWTDKVLDYDDFNLVVPQSGKVFTGGSKKDDLMSGHWEKHKYDGGKGNDHIFTWSGKDTLLGGDGKDHLYADGDDCTMVGGKGNDFFYLDGDSTSLIKDYRNNKDKDIIRVDGYNKGDIKISTKSGNSLVKAGKRTLAKVVGVKNLSKNELQYSGGNNNRATNEHDDHSGHDHSGHDHHGHAHHRALETNESDLLTELIVPAMDL